MTSHAQRRRRKLAAQLNVSNRTAKNIIKARVAEQRAVGDSPPLTGAKVASPPSPSIRHFYLENETDYEVEVLIFKQTVAHFAMLGGPLTDAGTKKRKFGWVSAWTEQLDPARTRASWVVDEGSWRPEWDPTEDELHDLAEKAMASDTLHRFNHVLVIHAPGRLAMMASDRPLPNEDATITRMFSPAMSAVPHQPILGGASPDWWPDGTQRPRVEEPPKPPSRTAKGEVYVLSQIVEAAHDLLERRPQTRIFTTSVNSLKIVDDRVGLNGEVAQVPLVDVEFVEDRPGQWYFDGEIAFIVGELYDGAKPVGGKTFETKEGRARLAAIIVESMDPWFRSILGHFSVRSGVQRGDNLIFEVSLSVIDKQEEAFGELVLALQHADGGVSLQRTRTAIAKAREALARVQDAAETPRQIKLAKRALGHEEHWKRIEESLTRIEAMDRGVFLPIR